MPSQYYALSFIVAVSAGVDLLLAASSVFSGGPLRQYPSRLHQHVIAYIMDMLVVAALTGALASTFGSAAALVAPFLVVIVAVVYPTLCYVIADITLGQRIARLCRTFSGRRHVAIGFSVAGFLCMVFGFPLGFLSMLFDSQGRTIEERLSRVKFD